MTQEATHHFPSHQDPHLTLFIHLTLSYFFLIFPWRNLRATASTRVLLVYHVSHLQGRRVLLVKSDKREREKKRQREREKRDNLEYSPTFPPLSLSLSLSLSLRFSLKLCNSFSICISLSMNCDVEQNCWLSILVLYSSIL